jgi:exodeoxyribonuclease V beta subunit
VGSTGRVAGHSAVFELCGDLPEGTTVLEASAGTGKTHTIAGLACRYLAEGLALIDELMLVTFGRAATAELRERVRERLSEVTAELGDPAAARASGDDLVRLLADAPDAEVVVHHRRLATALADFDAATIATTHGFCHQMLAGLGIAADLDHDVTFAESTGDLVTEVATDLYVGDYGREQSPPPLAGFGFTVATDLAGKAVGDPSAALAPQQYDAGSEPEVRVRFAERARTEVARRKRSMRVMDYDDLLTYLRDALTDPETGDDACDRIRTRYRIVLVDEFQDTDPVQWQILERAFHGHRTLVLIGDPKQAIYAFRGADVVTYLQATGAAGESATLGTNWRSDAPLLAAFDHVMGGAALGDQRIVVHPVAAAHPGRRVTGSAPFRLRVVDRDAVTPGKDRILSVGDARPYVARDVAADVVAALRDGRLQESGGERALRPGDIAVLVHSNREAALVRDALQRSRVPVVLTGTSSVFLSDAAADWLALLSALEQPQRTGLARAAALTDFLGWTPERLAADDDSALDELSVTLHEWGELLSRRGVAALLEAAGQRMVARLLAQEQGERRLTDLRHIGQVLHQAATEGRFGVASMVGWLQHRMAEAAADQTEERSRRLESDAESVQVITVHRSKGLEFPVVYATFLGD